MGKKVQLIISPNQKAFRRFCTFAALGLFFALNKRTKITRGKKLVELLVRTVVNLGGSGLVYRVAENIEIHLCSFDLGVVHK